MSASSFKQVYIGCDGSIYRAIVWCVCWNWSQINHDITSAPRQDNVRVSSQPYDKSSASYNRCLQKLIHVYFIGPITFRFNLIDLFITRAVIASSVPASTSAMPSNDNVLRWRQLLLFCFVSSHSHNTSCSPIYTRSLTSSSGSP